ncbi:hypothetical protein JNUCC0626_47595 [Lentzea sp. JNUCC 0626]|uniref:hypothetical protein n=1 Tax=Lentzea sp. JNUCC 0626 TaxID=3367513 RepID=UPI003748F6B3
MDGSAEPEAGTSRQLDCEVLMSDSIHQGGPGTAVGTPIAKGLWMLAASGVVAGLAVAGVLVSSPDEPSAAPFRPVLTTFAPADVQPTDPPVDDGIPVLPPPVLPVKVPAADTVAEVQPSATTPKPEAVGRSIVPERSRPVTPLAKVVAQPVQQVQAVVEAVQPAKIAPEVVQRVQAVALPARMPWFAGQFGQPVQAAPRSVQRPQIASFPAGGNIRSNPMWTFRSWPGCR